MVTLNLINNLFTAATYQGFTFPSYRFLLQEFQPDSSTLAIAAVDEVNKPVGLGLAESSSESEFAEILSIFVSPNYRNRGIGNGIIAKLQEELYLRGCSGARLSYTTGQPTTKALERILQKQDWLSPQAQQIVCKWNCQVTQVPWLQKSFRLPSEFKIFPWVEITDEERLALKKEQEENPWIPSDLDPFINEEDFEPLNSLGLKYHEKVVGWLLTHRISPDTIRYTCSFVRPDLQRMGRVIPLYQEATQRQSQIPDIPNVIWTVPASHPAMINFAKRHMAPYLNSLQEIRVSCKLFNGSIPII
ncbi:MAG: GNAT family N-acetyltransferase [Scytonematopsis contorta HA4267-MV1]|jgi:GNAT superfamily N-acetyltransferase|nr:GNAT family N-acetyltransferase [Scytonematopsis contorta HA4267-MV1]